MHETRGLRPPPAAVVGHSLAALATPALLIDLDAFEANLARMAELAANASVALRPHAKAHKSVAIAERQVAGPRQHYPLAKVPSDGPHQPHLTLRRRRSRRLILGCRSREQQ